MLTCVGPGGNACPSEVSSDPSHEEPHVPAAESWRHTYRPPGARRFGRLFLQSLVDGFADELTDEMGTSTNPRLVVDVLR